jgi:polysaccharide pyruvyl transferase WcaK-like protein
MHLAVMSLMAGTPALTIATQGKVEGLMELFGTPELCVPAGDGLEDRLPIAVADAIRRAPELRLRILDALPGVTRLAWANMDGLATSARQVAA